MTGGARIGTTMETKTTGQTVVGIRDPETFCQVPTRAGMADMARARQVKESAIVRGCKTSGLRISVGLTGPPVA